MVHSFRAAVAASTSARRLVLRRIAWRQIVSSKPFGAARALWQGWIYTPAVTRMGLSLAMPQSGPFLPRRRGPADCLAVGARALSRARPTPGAYCTARRRCRKKPCHALVRRTGEQVEDESPTEWLWLRATSAGRGRLDHHHARHAGESGGLSAAETQTARLRLSDRPHPGDLFALGGHGVGSGDRKVPRQADRRKQFVSPALRCVGAKAT